MSDEQNTTEKKSAKCHKGHAGGAGGGAVYGLGFIGAVIYYLQNAHAFWPGVLGVLKALVWPAMLIYKVLQTLHM